MLSSAGTAGCDSVWTGLRCAAGWKRPTRELVSLPNRAQRLQIGGPTRPARRPITYGRDGKLHCRTKDLPMAAIRQADVVASVADALQYISYYHPADYIEALAGAYAAEESPAARDAIAQILTNSRMCAEGHRPICQDTGIVVAFVKVGMRARFDDATLSLADMVNEGVRRAYLDPDNPLRASILSDPAGKRTNTRDNTPAVVHVDLVPGDVLEVKIAAKGGGSENKSKFTMLNPSDSIVDWVLKTVPTMGAGWCPPGMLGIGVGGSAEKAMLLAKEALMEPIDMHELRARGPSSRLQELRDEIYEKVNALGIGAQGL